jgi:CBS domain-containing protein
MLVKEAMTRRAETIGPDETLQVAARKMRELDIGALPVCEADRLVGVLTDRDIVVRSTAQGAAPNVTTVRTAMTAQVVYCLEGEDIATAADRMAKHAVRRVLVLNDDKRLTGMLSVDDLARFSRSLAAEIIEQSHEPGLPVHHGPWPWWE